MAKNRLEYILLVVLEYSIEKNCRVTSHSLGISSPRTLLTAAIGTRIPDLGGAVSSGPSRRLTLMLCFSLPL